MGKIHIIFRSEKSLVILVLIKWNMEEILWKI